MYGTAGESHDPVGLTKEVYIAKFAYGHADKVLCHYPEPCYTVARTLKYQYSNTNRACRTSATAFMRVFSPVNVFISPSSPARCISEIVSEQSLNAKTAWFSVFGCFSFYYRYYFWY